MKTYTMENKVQRFATYSQYAKNWLIENEIKLKTVFVKDGNYNPHFIYISRIGNCNKNKAKFRVLQPGEKVKNCIMVTFNVERWNKEYLAYLITSKVAWFRNVAHGSCQTFLTQDMVAQVLSGAVGKNGINIKEVLY